MNRLVRTISSVCVLFLLLLCVGCAVRLIADYDSILDQSMTSLQQETEAFIAQLTTEVNTPAAQYVNNTDFYIKAQATLRTMATRAGATPKSSQVIAQIQELEKTFALMQNSHQNDGQLSLVYLGDIERTLNTEFTAVTTLELYLKNHPVPVNALAPATH